MLQHSFFLSVLVVFLLERNAVRCSNNQQKTMQLTEKGTLVLEIDDTQSAGRMAEIDTQLKNIDKQLKGLKEAGDTGSEGYKALKLEQRELTLELNDLKKTIDVNDASLNELNKSLRYWQGEAKKAKVDSEEWIQATMKVGEIKNRVREVNEEMDQLGGLVKKQSEGGGIWSNFKTQALGVFTGMGLLELAKSAGQAMLDFGMEVFETTAKFEKYETVLRVALGTQEAAGEAMNKLKKFAAETPFTLDEITESYIKYVNRGLAPSIEEMTKLGDVAASQNKSLDQLTEAVLDASMGEFERLKEFSIEGSKAGDSISLAFKQGAVEVKENADGTATVIDKVTGKIVGNFENQRVAVQKAIVTFGELEGVKGQMEAQSLTLEGRLATLSDKFDDIKVIIGNALMPVFSFFLDLLSGGIQIMSDLLSGNTSLSESSSFLGGVIERLGSIFSAIWDVLYSVIQIGIDLFVALAKITDNVIGLSGGGRILESVLGIVGFALRVVGSAAIAALGAVQLLADGFNVILNKGKELVNFFSPGTFKIDATATFENLQKNAERNLKSIENVWVETSKKGADSSIAATERATAAQKAGAEKQTATEKKESEKRIAQAQKQANDKAKIEADLQKKLEDMNVKAIADDTQRAIAKVDLDLKREQDAIKKTIADDSTKKKALEAAEKVHTTAIAKIKSDAAAKEKKEKEEKEKKEAAEQKKKEADEKKYRDEKLKNEKALLDDEFKAAASKAKLELALTKDNSAAMWAAKLKILNIETEHKRDKLRQEAAAEKARIAESITDETQKAARIKAIDDALTAELSLNEQELQEKKRKLQADANAAKKKNTDEFYSALNLAMKGDMNGFMQLLQEKYSGESTNLQKRLQANMQHIQGVGTAMLAGVESLKKLNEDYTKRQIDNLTREKDKNIKLEDEKLKKNIERISGSTKKEIEDINRRLEESQLAANKDEKLQAELLKRKSFLEKVYNESIEKAKQESDAEKLKLQDKYDADVLELKKKEFERNKKMQIASALIAGSMAVLSALATPPFPVGLAMAVIAGVKTAVDISKIKKTQFEAQDGYVSNAGILRGGRHGSQYGKGGIAMYDRATGEEIGEAEGGEAFMILSRETTKNNLGLIRRLMHSSLNRNGAPVTLANGGILPIGAVDKTAGRMASSGMLKMWEQGTFEGQDYSGETTAAAYDENKMLAANMDTNSTKTAQNTGLALERLDALIGISERIANKPTGISLHDLNNAVGRAMNASNRSDL